MQHDKIIFVTGATGNQGGAVARNLQKRGFTVKALTRNPDSAKASSLKKLNVDIIKGDLNNADTYREHLKNAYGVFSVQTFEKGVDKEIQQGNTLATIAKQSGVQHFLYSSATGAHLHSGVPHLESKLKIENHIKATGLPFTILRPASFYENCLIPQVKKGILKGKYVHPTNGETIMQYIASDDIGKAAAQIFEKREMYLYKTLPLAAEQFTTRQVAEVFSGVMGRPIECKKLPPIITRLFIGKSVYQMFKWMDEKNRFVKEDIDFTRNEFGDLLSLKTWIGKHF